MKWEKSPGGEGHDKQANLFRKVPFCFSIFHPAEKSVEMDVLELLKLQNVLCPQPVKAKLRKLVDLK